MEHFLGRLEWAVRPQGGTAPFLAGAYRWKLSSGDQLPAALIRPLLTAVVFAVLPEDFATQSHVWRGPPASVEGNILFVDAAPRRKSGFHFGFFCSSEGC